jgi:hypothetical protein
MTKMILILAANPKDTPQIRLDQEVREIDNGLRRARRRDEFNIKQQWAVRRKDVRRAMLDFKPTIVHFCGHGRGEEGIVLEDERGYPQLVSAKALAGFFKLFAEMHNLRCVFFNACYSEIQAEAIAQHVDYVIGMKKNIEDKTAIEFAVAFYDALGSGESFQFAFELAYNSMQWGKQDNMLEELNPILKSRIHITNDKRAVRENESLSGLSALVANCNKVNQTILHEESERIWCDTRNEHTFIAKMLKASSKNSCPPLNPFFCC